MDNVEATVLQRFMIHVEVDSDTGCWVWTGELNNSGYGRWWCPDLKRRVMAHHASWRLHGRPAVPDGYELDHGCVNPRCVNPDHLEPVTHAENMRRSWERRGLLYSCRRGHDLADGSPNVYRKPGGERRCMACARLHRTKYNHRVRKQSKRRVVA